MDAPTILRAAAAGLAATAAMSLLELAVRSRWGLEGLLDWQQNQAVPARMLRRPVESVVGPGLGLHFLHGLLAGIVLVLILPFVPPGIPLGIVGIVFGIVLFAITLALHKPLTGRPSWAVVIGVIPIGVAFLTHVAYGTFLALFIVWP